MTVTEIVTYARKCSKRHEGQEYPFCESFGCMDVLPLAAALAAADALAEALVEQPDAICAACWIDRGQHDDRCPVVKPLAAYRALRHGAQAQEG